MSRTKHSLHQSRYLLMPDGSQIDLSGSEYLCPVCQAEEKGKVRYRFDGFDLVSCPVCCVLHLSPLPDPAGLARLYDTNYFKDPEERHGYRDYAEDIYVIRKTYRLRAEKILACCPPSFQIKNLHEVGCALGIGLEIAAGDFHFRVSGSDLSQEAIKACRAKGFSCFRSDSFGRCDLSGLPPIDLVWLFDVIEHLTDIPKFLDWLVSITSNRAIVAITTPDIDSGLNVILGRHSPSIKIPQHVVYFSSRTLVRALEKNFQLIASTSDLQYVRLRAFGRRILHILGLNLSLPAYEPRISFPFPNGMRLYVFQKKS